MSTIYTLVNSKKKEEAKKLAQVLTGIQKHCNSELAAVENEVPLMADTIEDIRVQIRQALQRCEPGYTEDRDDIGTSISRGFSWAVHNGYQCLEDVRTFLGKHPGYHIEDEYGTEVSLEDFAKLVSGNDYTVRLPKEAAGK